MSDTKKAVNSGFYDSINNDRTYTADDMTKPYKRIVSDGIFATNAGTPSTDFQVVPGSGLGVIVKPGDAIVGNRWFQSAMQLGFAVPGNTGLSSRYDSIILQVDAQSSGRVGNVIYRTGGATPPDLSSASGVTEYRVANIEVPSNAMEIFASYIEDLRGSSSCPWVTGLITQVDTSTLFAQYQDAYRQQFNAFTAAYETYVQEQQENWAEFIEGLTEQLNVSMNLVMLTNDYVASTTTDTIPIGIASLAPGDLLMICINGIFADQSKYTISGSNIILTEPIAAGNMVNIMCFKALASGDVSAVSSLIQQINDRIDDLHADTGWINLALANGTAGVTPQVRKIGDQVFIRGTLTGTLPALDAEICTLPPSCVPDAVQFITTDAVGGTTGPAIIRIDTTGKLALIYTAAASCDLLPLDKTFVI